MSVRKTESRIPANFKPDDLGQAVVAADGRCALVSFITSPLVINRENVYVVFVTDAALAGVTQSFEWSFTENEGVPDIQMTQYGEVSYRPKSIGKLNLVVRILGAGNAEQASLTLPQEIVPLNAELEALINDARNQPGPGVSNPDVARELINDHNPYYQGVVLQTPEGGDGFKQFVFSMVSDGTLQRTTLQRKQHLDQLAASLNSQGADFVTLTAEGAGVCSIRLALLAMTLPQVPGNPATLLNWTELPEPPDKRAFGDEQLRQNLAALNEDMQVDLFNLARFPKSNITQCGRILEALRDRYFNGTNFSDVLTGMSGTRAVWITRHFREGPLVRS
jgi:hypothetical protein